MFFDWVEVYQEYDFELPIVTGEFFQIIDTETGEALKAFQPSFKHEGSYSTSISIKISGNRLTVKGNPSRYGRLDNLFGLTSLDDCIKVYNRILRLYKLPEFTKCTKVFFRSDDTNGSAVLKHFSDGAIFKEIHITENKAVGEGHVKDYIKGLSTLSYRYSLPRLHTNGCTVDWLTKKANAPLIYPSVYEKSNEINLHSLTKIKNKYGEDSKEFKYLQKVINYCTKNGVVRFEQKLKGRFLTRINARYWGLFDETEKFKKIHNEFLRIDEKLQVTSMDIETIVEKLISEGICNNIRSANSTAIYALGWMHGQVFDLKKSQVRTVRSRLRRIGIDIGLPCDITRTSPVYVKKATEVTVSDLNTPSWYNSVNSNPLLLVV